MSNALHDYAKLFERYAANNGGTGVILEGEDCLSLANEMRMDADIIEVENVKLRELIVGVHEALCTDKAGIFHKLIIASMEDDMRELGVEVN